MCTIVGFSKCLIPVKLFLYDMSDILFVFVGNIPQIIGSPVQNELIFEFFDCSRGFGLKEESLPDWAVLVRIDTFVDKSVIQAVLYRFFNELGLFFHLKLEV